MLNGGEFEIVDYLPSMLLVGARRLARSLVVLVLVSTSRWADIGADSSVSVVIDPLKRSAKNV